jgi:hypothetical protein
LFDQKNWFAFDNRMEIENDVEAKNGNGTKFFGTDMQKSQH